MSHLNTNLQSLQASQAQLLISLSQKLQNINNLKVESDKLKDLCQSKILQLRCKVKILIKENKQDQSIQLLSEILEQGDVLNKICQRKSANETVFKACQQLQKEVIKQSVNKSQQSMNGFKTLKQKLLAIAEEQNQINVKFKQQSNKKQFEKEKTKNLLKQLQQEVQKDKTNEFIEKFEAPQLRHVPSSQYAGKITHGQGEHYVDSHNHYHHVQPPLIIKKSQLNDPVIYLMDIYKTKQKVDNYFMRNCQSYIDYWKRQYGVNFTTNGYQLISVDVVINMEEFLKQNWSNVQYIGFKGSKIDDMKWRMFVQHSNLFPNLKWLCIHIKHTMTIKQGDLQKFKSLERIEFIYEQWTHPLTLPSKNYLKSFAKAHPQIQVAFG